MANKALKEAAREMERREALTRQDHAVPRGGLAAEAQVPGLARVVLGTSCSAGCPRATHMGCLPSRAAGMPIRAPGCVRQHSPGKQRRRRESSWWPGRRELQG